LFHCFINIKESYFYELTTLQYEQLEMTEGNIKDRWYMLLPDNYRYHTPEALIVTEREKNNLLSAVKLIERYGINESFSNYQDKLKYVSNITRYFF
jgi:hypothetical protein